MKYFLFLILSAIIFSACSSEPDLRKEKAALLLQLQQERKAHFDRNVDLFMAEFADSMINVNRGMVAAPSKAEHRERIGKYFGSVRFIKWDDVAEPVIRFSRDATLAYAIIQKMVVLSYPVPEGGGSSKTDTTEYAWLSIYRKQKGEWKVECNVSTNK